LFYSALCASNPDNEIFCLIVFGLTWRKLNLPSQVRRFKIVNQPLLLIMPVEEKLCLPFCAVDANGVAASSSDRHDLREHGRNIKCFSIDQKARINQCFT